jgi:hypothetical protein
MESVPRSGFREISLREIATTSVRNRSCYWHQDDTIDAAVAAAEAVQNQGIEAIIDAMEREIKKREFICNFDDPCDEWPPYLDNPAIRLRLN